MERTIAVLECLAADADGLILAELAARVVVSQSSLLAILRTLERLGYVERDRATRRFRVAPPLFALGKRAGRFSKRQSADRASVAAAVARLTRTLAQAIDEPVAETDRGQRSASASVWLSSAAGPISPSELHRFLNEPWLASLACVKENGFPHVVPIWYDWDGRYFWIVPRKRAEWAAHLHRYPRVSLTISEPEPPLRRVLVEGLAEAVEDVALAREVERRLAERYLREHAPAYSRATQALPRGLFRIVPEKMVSWRGLAPHPRYYQPADPAGEEAVNL